jgi:hypothetical protein
MIRPYTVNLLSYGRSFSVWKQLQHSLEVQHGAVISVGPLPSKISAMKRPTPLFLGGTSAPKNLRFEIYLELR